MADKTVPPLWTPSIGVPTGLSASTYPPGGTLVFPAGAGSGGGTVTSVGLTLPGSVFSVAGSPVTGAGTLTGSFISQTQNTFLAAPNGSSGVPSFRALVAADIPSLPYGTGTVTSVGLTMPAIFSVAGSPVTTSGTLAVTLATETANTVWAGPTTGAAATPTFRALVAADMPAGAMSPLTTKGDIYTFSTVNARLPVGANNTLFVADSAQTTGNKWQSASSLIDAVFGSTRGMLLRRGSSAWEALGLGTNGQAVVSDGTDAKWGTVGGGSGGGYAKIGTTTVAGSAATSMTVNGFSTSSYVALHVIFALKDATNTSTGTINLFYNSDTTTTDYNEQALTLNGAAVTSARANDARMGNLDPNRYTTGFMFIVPDINGRASALVFSNRDNTAGIVWQSCMHVWTTNFANVTGITLSSSIASQLAIGSTFTVYGINP